jgi:acyl-CoA reductase-like NAD-dependent aldehyde dehydrogenase
VVVIIRARDVDHADLPASDSAYGLAASVFTRDIALRLSIARRICSSICHVNSPTILDEP